MAEPRLNFDNVSALVVDRDQYSLTLTRQMLRGFGLRTQYQARSGDEAQKFLRKTPVDLCIVEARLTDMSGYDLVHWIRRRPEEILRFMPVMLLSGYTQMRNVATSRDCGANCIVRKPFSPKVLYDHIVWSAASKRPHLESSVYIGPDRRFHDLEDTAPARRVTDEDAPAPDPDAAPDIADDQLRRTRA